MYSRVETHRVQILMMVLAAAQPQSSQIGNKVWEEDRRARLDSSVNIFIGLTSTTIGNGCGGE